MNQQLMQRVSQWELMQRASLKDRHNEYLVSLLTCTASHYPTLPNCDYHNTFIFFSFVFYIWLLCL